MEEKGSREIVRKEGHCKQKGEEPRRRGTALD